MHHGNRQTRRAAKARAKAGAKTSAATAAAGIEPIGLRLPVAFGIIGCGTTKGYEFIAAGRLKTYRVGLRGVRATMESTRALTAELIAEEEARRASKAA
jgi:hypothetical protein